MSDWKAIERGALAFIVFTLLLGGVIGTIIAPSNLTKLVVPLGLTLWAILAWMLARDESPPPPNGNYPVDY